MKKKQSGDFDPFRIQEGVFRHGQIEGYSYRLNWTEESYSSRADAWGEAVGKTFDFKKIRLAAAVLFFALSVLFLRVAWLQVVKGDYYYAMAEGNRIRINRVEARRGVIYDRNGKLLVKNVANFMLYVVPSDLPKDEAKRGEVIVKLGKILKDELNVGELFTEINAIKPGSLESYQPFFLLDNIAYEKAVLLYLEMDQLPGVVLTNKERREYDLSSLSLSHILGYTGKINEQELTEYGEEYLPIDYIGKMGVEYFWETELKGVNGSKQVEVDALGREKKIISQTDPKDGHNLVLSIDSEAQMKLAEIMNAYLEKMNLGKASGIVLDPNNGEVLALVSLPAYNANAFAKGISQEEYSALINHPDKPLFNRAISGEYPSGSTIKPVIAAAALQEKIITENTSFLSVGGIRISSWFFPDWRAGGHGITNVRKAIADSVNTFFYYIGGGYEDFVGLGVDKIVEYGKKFGLGAQTGIDLNGEASGFLPTKEWKEETKGEIWYIGDTYHLAIGQGDLLATPLQIANFTAVFANGGKLYSPHLVREILTGEGNRVRLVEPNLVRDVFIDPYNIEVVRQGMRRTVTDGSGVRLSSLPVAVAGKTGTAQWSSQKDPHAWFTGFAPYDKPELVITLLVEEGKEGSAVTVSIAHDFLQWYFSRN